MSSASQEIALGRKAIPISLWTIAVALIAGHVIAGVTDIEKSFLHLGREQTIPAVFSTVLLLLASVVLAFIGQVPKNRRQPYSFYWSGLALVFTFLALDEAVEFHE